MNHIESKTKIYFTKDYSIFSKILGNRELNATKIKKIKTDIENGLDILMYCPILVFQTDEKLEIIDGQHRFKVAQLLKTFIWYCLVDELTLNEIAKINSNQEKWKQKDFINCYVQNGNENYIELKKFNERFGFAWSISLQMLKNGYSLRDMGNNESAQKEFESGSYVVKTKEIAYSLAEIIFEFKDFKHYDSRLFIVAIARIIEAKKIDIKDVVASFKKNQTKLEVQYSWKLYIQNLETIVNIGKHSRIIIY